MDENDWIETNRLAWDQAAPLHHANYFQRLREQFRTPGFSCLGPNTTQLFNTIGYRGKDIVQPCCNNGRELVSLKNMGAGRCAGFDFSEPFIAHARQLADTAGIECEFVACDVLKIPEQYARRFDIVYLSVGTLRWFQDLPRFMSVVAGLLKARGHLLLFEMHPILDMFASDLENPAAALRTSYFHTAPFMSTHGLDYYGRTNTAASPVYYFHHKLSDIVQAVSGNGMTLRHFEERPDDISWAYSALAKQGKGLPMSYSLIAQASG